jgi:PAS domain S-box-containing protein
VVSGRTEAALRESTALLGRLRDANVLGVMLVSEQGILEANDALLDIIGYDRDEVAAGNLSLQDLTPPESAGRDREAIGELRRTGAIQPYDKDYVHRDGHRVPVLVGSALVDRRPLRWVTFVVDLSARQRAERERTGLQLRERAARAEAEQAQERLALLMHAGALAAASGDRQQLLQQVTQLVVPSLADYCVVFLPADGSLLRAAAFTHRDPEGSAILSQLLGQREPTTGPMFVQAAYTTGAPRLVTDLSAEMRGWALAEPGAADALARARPTSAVAVPLTAGPQRLGVMVMGRNAGRPRFAATDLEMIGELARRLAAGLAAATAQAVQHTIAETLQRSLLPALPGIPGLDLAARYLPATTGADIGGDWYDVFEAGPSKVGLVIGDVIGHSLASASMMGQIRSMLRAYAVHQPHPLSVLRRTGRAMARLLPTALATVTCALLDIGTGEFSYASAGHLPPLLVGGDGRTEFLDGASGVMLGATADPWLRPARRRLQPGDSVLFYTDGLVESRSRDLSEGLTALASTLTGPPGRAAEQICGTAQGALLPAGGRADDVCLLAVRWPGRRPAAGTAG